MNVINGEIKAVNENIIHIWNQRSGTVVPFSINTFSIFIKGQSDDEKHVPFN